MATLLLFIPPNDKEIYFCIVTTLILCGMFGYSLNTIGILLQDI